MKYYVGLDIGGTHGRIKLQSEDGRVLGMFRAAGCSVNTDGYEKSRQCCRELVLPFIKKWNLEPRDCRGICGAVSGVDSPEIGKACEDIFEEMGFPRDRIKILNDCEVFLHLLEEPALVLVSGTGSVCYGRDGDGRIYRTGGWNHIISDKGSGFDLGLRFLQAAADELDGRKKTQCLTSMIIEVCKADSLDHINTFVNENLFKKSKIAALAETGCQAAVNGDVEALRIHEACTDCLVKLVFDTLNKFRDPGCQQITLWLWGSVLVKNIIVQQSLTRKVMKKNRFIQIKIPELNALDAALQLAGAAF